MAAKGKGTVQQRTVKHAQCADDAAVFFSGNINALYSRTGLENNIVIELVRNSDPELPGFVQSHSP